MFYTIFCKQSKHIYYALAFAACLFVKLPFGHSAKDEKTKEIITALK
jgi:hypothetical protein